MRLEVILRGPRVGVRERLELHDTNYAGRIGWKEIVVGARTPSVSHELHAYPKSLLQSPRDVTRITVAVAPTHDPAPTLTRGRALQAPDRVADSGFTALIAQRDLSPLVILAALAAALFWGAAHALSPGHGKTIVAAYLIGKRGTVRDAAALGGIVTVTHTIGVFALGLVTLGLSQWIVPDRLYPWLNLAAGVSVLLIGAAVLRSRAREWLHERAHRHGHHHDHDHGHHHPEPGDGFRGLLAVGVSGGLLPCPSALVVLLAAVSLHRLAFGLVLIVASAGLAPDRRRPRSRPREAGVCASQLRRAAGPRAACRERCRHPRRGRRDDPPRVSGRELRCSDSTMHSREPLTARRCSSCSRSRSSSASGTPPTRTTSRR
jgi:hypothetical protein